MINRSCNSYIAKTLAMALIFGLCPGGAVTSWADAPNPNEVRKAALQIGLDSLTKTPVPVPFNLTNFIKPGEGAEKAAIQLGKALFWDMQVGSDGQSCGTCHFHAGADSRTKNQLQPGVKNEDPALRTIFNPTGSGNPGGPNYRLVPEDFPFHKLQDPEQESFNGRVVLFDTDDVTSSQGVFNANFVNIVPGQPGDVGTPFPDTVFNVGGINTRRVEPRNTPTMINAVFNFANFWDGRAHNSFNGVSVIGPLDDTATVSVNQGGVQVDKKIRIPNSSLASQAVGPPQSDLEMSFFNRPFPEIGAKLLSLRPLGLQKVDPNDSVLGGLARARIGKNGEVIVAPGLKTTYAGLIKKAFRAKYWTSGNPAVENLEVMKKNFSLFFGLAVQMYESTLVSDKSRFDKFMEGDNTALTSEEQAGLLTFINRGRPEQLANPIFTGVSQGNCVSCHGGPEFTDASVANVSAEPIEVEATPELQPDGLLVVGAKTTFLDNGFSNIGVRKSSEDLGRGAEINGIPLSFSLQAINELPFAPELGDCGIPGSPVCPENERTAVNGAFKIPGLRNVELTGPYFHNGGQATLKQVVEFYDRHGDFSDVNVENLDRNIARVVLHDADEEPLIKFLLTLTDPRVKNEQAPFDHPQLFVPDGHPGNRNYLDCVEGVKACDDFMEIPAVGEGGRPAAGLEPLGTFLGVAHD